MRAVLAAVLAALGAAGVVAASSGGGTGGWKTLRPAGLERTEVTAARIGNHVYVVGGFDRATASPSSAVERYDIAKNRWRRMRPMPVPLHHTTATVHDGRLYVHGGYSGTTAAWKPEPTLYEYRPARDRWRALPSARTARAAHAAAVIGGRLYVAGGSTAAGSASSFESYDFERRKWRGGPAFPGPARNHLTGAASSGRFYVFGGRDSANYTEVARYDPGTRRWARLPGLTVARGGIAAATLPGGRIAVFGGEELSPGGKTIAPVELFDTRKLRWSSLPEMRTPRHGLGGVAKGRRIYAIEGGPSPGFHFSRAIEALDVR